MAGHRGGRGSTSCIEVLSGSWVVVDGDGGVVDEAQSGTFDHDSHRHLEVNLSPSASKSVWKCEGLSPIGRVDPLEHIDKARWADASMVVTDQLA